MRRHPPLPLHVAVSAALILAVTVPAAMAAAPSPAPTAAAPAKPSLTLGSGLNSTRVGDVTVHYNAMPSTQLRPDIATRYGITRSSNRALVNVSVMKGPRAAEAVAVPAEVALVAINPAGQRQAVRLSEVRDRGAIYYLGEARIEERDTIDFELTVTPEGGAPINARFRQEFWPPAPVR